MMKSLLKPLSYFAFCALLLAACSTAPTATANVPVAASATMQPSATFTPQPPTATPQPTATATPQPTATATATVTQTAIPALAVLPDGFFAWCNPNDYAGINLPGAIAPETSLKLAQVGEMYQVQIPAEYCVMVYTFNQDVPQGLTLQLFNGGLSFVSVPLTIDAQHPQMVYAAVRHPYVIDPPFWEVTYRAAVTRDGGTELRSDMVKFARPLPSNCPYGGLPDPVTLKCAISDPWEMEPHPGIVYPYPTFTPETK